MTHAPGTRPSLPPPGPHTGRRTLLATLAGLALLPAWAASAAGARRTPPAALHRDAWMALGEQALATGRPRRAADCFEIAARLDDQDPDAELGQMRAALLAGDYAQAVSWGLLVAGEHTHAPWAQAWADAVQALAQPGLGAPPAPAASSPPEGPVPPMPGPARPAGAQAWLRGLLARGPGGLQLLLPPGAALPAAARLREHARTQALRVSDGTGRLFLTGAVPGDGPLALHPAPLQGAEPPASLALPPLRTGQPHLGRPVLALDTAQAPSPAAGWPRLRAGVLALAAGAGPGTPADTGLRLALAGPALPDGSPVFDACGFWLGWAAGGRLLGAGLGDLPPDLHPNLHKGADAQQQGPGACAAGPSGDMQGLFSQRYTGLATVWQPG